MTTTKIYIILDRSGSMESCVDDTIGGFNSFINKQKDIDNLMTIVTSEKISEKVSEKTAEK